MKKTILTRIFLNSFFTLVMFATMLSGSHIAHATDGASTTITIDLQNPISANTFQQFIDSVMTGVVELLTPVIVLMFLWTGFLFIKAQGNGEKLGEAKKALMYTIIGAALVLGADGLSKVLESTFTGI